VSISGNANTVIQEEADWLDVGAYQGVVVYAEVAFVNNQASQTSLDIQTAPARDEVFFAATLTGGNAWVATFPFTTSPPTGVQTLAVRRWTDSTTSTTQPQLLLRWRVRFPAVETNITFRIWLNLLRTGGHGILPCGSTYARSGGASSTARKSR
jgi:hypothetical protein